MCKIATNEKRCVYESAEFDPLFCSANKIHYAFEEMLRSIPILRIFADKDTFCKDFIEFPMIEDGWYQEVFENRRL